MSIDDHKKMWANSGDSHVLEPDDIWSSSLPPHLADRMPRTEKHDGVETIHVDGQSVQRRIGVVRANGEHWFRGKVIELEEGIDANELSQAPGSRDIGLRLKDLDNEGIWGEVVYPSVGLWNGMIKDPVLYREGVKVLNDWLYETIVRVTPRLVPAAEISTLSVDDAVAEAVRVAEMGFHALSLPTTLDREVAADWNDESWEPLWAVAEEASLVLAFHIGSDAKPPDQTNVKYRGQGGAVINYVETSFGGQRAAVMLISSGALDRHPNLRMLVSEGGATWGPAVADRMDEAYRQHGMFVRPVLSRLPSEILYEQVYASFQHDRSAVKTSTELGFRNVLWGSDYPHMEGTFGHTQKTLRELFDGVDPADVYRITQGAFLELFPSVGPVGRVQLNA